MNKKLFLLSHADVAADVVRTKQRRHAAAYENVTSHAVYMC